MAFDPGHGSRAPAAAASTPNDASTDNSLAIPDDQNESHSSSSSNSPAPRDNEESDFFLGNNDSQSSLGVMNLQDMNVDDQCYPPINRLPNEIFLAVFSKLSSTSDIYHCLLVSRRWARNAVDLLWHRPACTNWSKHKTICHTLGEANPYFPYHDFIKRLNLASLADNVNDGSIIPLSVCTRVERLTLTNCKQITDTGLIALVENSASLLAIDISNDRNITEQSIIAMAEHCKRLQGLNISGCEQISNDSMITLAQNCKYIKRVSCANEVSPADMSTNRSVAETQRMLATIRRSYLCFRGELPEHSGNRFTRVQAGRQRAHHLTSSKRQLSS